MTTLSLQKRIPTARPLTWVEGDANFSAIEAAVNALSTSGTLPAYDSGTTYGGGSSVIVQHDGAIFTFVSPTDQTGVTPGTNPAVWMLTNIGDLAHQKDRDNYLAFGTSNQVSAAEIRGFIDSFFNSTTIDGGVFQEQYNTGGSGYPIIALIGDDILALIKFSVTLTGGNRGGTAVEFYKITQGPDFSQLPAGYDGYWMPGKACVTGRRYFWGGRFWLCQDDVTGSDEEVDNPAADAVNFVQETGVQYTRVYFNRVEISPVVSMVPFVFRDEQQNESADPSTLLTDVANWLPCNQEPQFMSGNKLDRTSLILPRRGFVGSVSSCGFRNNELVDSIVDIPAEITALFQGNKFRKAAITTDQLGGPWGATRRVSGEFSNNEIHNATIVLPRPWSGTIKNGKIDGAFLNLMNLYMGLGQGDLHIDSGDSFNGFHFGPHGSDIVKLGTPAAIPVPTLDFAEGGGHYDLVGTVVFNFDLGGGLYTVDRFANAPKCPFYLHNTGSDIIKLQTTTTMTAAIQGGLFSYVYSTPWLYPGCSAFFVPRFFWDAFGNAILCYELASFLST